MKQVPPEVTEFLRRQDSDDEPVNPEHAVGLAIDVQSNTWLSLAPYLEQEIAGSLTRLASPNLPEGPTEFERGYIAAMRKILKLPERARRGR